MTLSPFITRAMLFLFIGRTAALCVGADTAKTPSSLDAGATSLINGYILGVRWNDRQKATVEISILLIPPKAKWHKPNSRCNVESHAS